MNSSPSAPTALRRAIEVMMRGLTTNEPGVIESYDANRVTATVQPLIMQRRVLENGDTQLVRRGVVQNAPVIFLGGGDARLTFPVKRGDECILIAASRSLDRWSTFGGEVDPASERHHDLTDSFVLVTPHLSPASVRPANATATVLESGDLRLGDDTAQALAMKTAVDGFFSILNMWAPVTGDGGAALKLSFTNYIASHPGWPQSTTKVKGS